MKSNDYFHCYFCVCVFIDLNYWNFIVWKIFAEFLSFSPLVNVLSTPNPQFIFWDHTQPLEASTFSGFSIFWPYYCRYSRHSLGTELVRFQTKVFIRVQSWMWEDHELHDSSLWITNSHLFYRFVPPLSSEGMSQRCRQCHLAGVRWGGVRCGGGRVSLLSQDPIYLSITTRFSDLLTAADEEIAAWSSKQDRWEREESEALSQQQQPWDTRDGKLLVVCLFG